MCSRYALVAILLMLFSMPSRAATDYDFHLLEVDVTGLDPFYDDFADGDRFAPPTWRIFDAAGSTTEQPGYLRFQGADGGDPLVYLNGAVGVIDLAAFLDSFGSAFLVFPDGGGPAQITSTWSADLPVLAPGEFVRGYTTLVQVVSEATGGSTVLYTIEVGAFASWTQPPPGGCSVGGPNVLIEYTTDGEGAVLACDPLDPGSAAPETVTLRIVLDDSADTLSFAYSLDGGASFKDSSQWLVPVSAVFVPELSGGAMAPMVGAYGAGFEVLPGPGPSVAAALLVCGAVLLRRRQRRPTLRLTR